MSSTLLQTKLFVPPARSDRIDRPRLLARLDEALAGRLTLVSAPAGFGKTTLLSAWIAQRGRPVAWLSLDEADGTPARFVGYLVAALRSLGVEVGIGASRLLQAPQPPIDAVLTTLLNEIAAARHETVLVLDDYHAVGGGPVDEIVAFLLERAPPLLHLVIASRAEPELPLARLRARGELAELRAAELRFTPDEAARFLTRAAGLELSADEAAALGARTEGWIAGLQLAALSLRGRADAAGFIEAFAGSHRFVLDYLVEEVLERQPDAVRRFLLETAVLERLHGSLCDAVTGRSDGDAMLAALERGNLFVVPLDDERRWYRYHHLFAEVLRARLSEREPDRMGELHRRASAWFEERELLFEAIRHAFGGGEVERAADLIERAWPVMRKTYNETPLLRWAERLPAALLRARPALNVHYAFALLSTEPAAAEPYLRDAERWLETTADAADDARSAGRAATADEAERRALPGMIAIARAYQAGASRDGAATTDHARRALELLPADAHRWRGAAAVILGLARWSDGDLEGAHDAIVAGVTEMRSAADVSAAISAATLLIELRGAQGRLERAARTCRWALALAAEQGAPAPQGTADVHVLLGALHYERGELDEAERQLRTAEDLGEHAASLVTRHHRWILQARLAAARGDPDRALDLLDEAERVQVANPVPDARPVTAWRARIQLAQGRLSEVRRWARERNLSARDEPVYLREFEHLTLARLRLAEIRRERRRPAVEEVAELLGRLLRAAKAARRTASRVEILLLQALVHEARGDVAAALPPLRRALALAAPEGYVRVFVDEGEPAARLLREAVYRETEPEYAARLLEAFAPVPAERDDALPESRAVPEAELAEPLSAREREVLERLAEGLTNQHIADRLGLALNTVKVHTRNIYGKLGVHNRTQAVARGRALGLLPLR